MFRSFFLSATGYRYLGFDPANNPSFDQQAFLHGMKAAQHRLNAPHQDVWDEGFKEDIHAVVMLADDDEHCLLREAYQWLGEVKAYATICAVERGRVMRNAHGDVIEHFGYADSGSQPLFFQKEVMFQIWTFSGMCAMLMPSSAGGMVKGEYDGTHAGSLSLLSR